MIFLTDCRLVVLLDSGDTICTYPPIIILLEYHQTIFLPCLAWVPISKVGKEQYEYDGRMVTLQNPESKIQMKKDADAEADADTITLTVTLTVTLTITVTVILLYIIAICTSPIPIHISQPPSHT